jgi:hypothetical protein
MEGGGETVCGNSQKTLPTDSTRDFISLVQLLDLGGFNNNNNDNINSNNNHRKNSSVGC